MPLAGYRTTTRPCAVQAADDRWTDPKLFKKLLDRFGFTVDVAASAENAKCPKFYTRQDSGLVASWEGEVVWCNPPFSEIRPWVEKAWREADRAECIVLLVPANRTEQGWWQELVESRRDKSDRFRVEFLAGRIRFAKATRNIGPNQRPPFGCCLLIWRKEAAS